MPGGKAAHADAAQIDAIRICMVFFRHLPDEGQNAFDFHHPISVGAALRHDKNGILQILVSGDFGKSIDKDQIQLFVPITPFSGTVQLHNHSRFRADVVRNIRNIRQNCFANGVFCDLHGTASFS